MKAIFCRSALSSLGLCLVAGCVSAPPLVTSEDLQPDSVYHSPLDVPKHATAGDEVLMQALVKQMPAFEMSRSIASTMPGSMRLPFAFSIEASTLTYARTDGRFDYYPAPRDKVTASHPMLGSVIEEEDEVGMRIEQAKGSGTATTAITIDRRRFGPGG